MRIQLNGKDVEAPEGSSLADLIAQRVSNPKQAVVSLNRNVVPSDRWTAALVAEGDAVEIFSFVGGG